MSQTGEKETYIFRKIIKIIFRHNHVTNKRRLVMNILVLYSWEDNYQRAQEWAMALCLELQRYESVTAECDMLFLPQSDRLKEIRNKILSADKILVVLTKSYIEKIESKRGTVSFEENLYKERIDNDTEENRIAFVLKEKNILYKIYYYYF